MGGFQVVAGAISSAVTLDVALDSLENGGASTINIRLPHIDEGESGVDGIDGQFVPEHITKVSE